VNFIPVFDLDGTLLDSDSALAAPFVALGVPGHEVTFGHVFEDECARLGITPDDYVAHYDVSLAQPFPGVEDLVARLGRWAICSNKHGPVGRAELARLGWTPEVALFADHFGGPKRLDPALAALHIDAAAAVFVGDTAHDRACADASGVRFALAGWNARVEPAAGDILLRRPLDLLGLIGNDRRR
jgi:HAD superfamily hydrolase (TIGR01549 family)